MCFIKTSVCSWLQCLVHVWMYEKTVWWYIINTQIIRTQSRWSRTCFCLSKFYLLDVLGPIHRHSRPWPCQQHWTFVNCWNWWNRWSKLQIEGWSMIWQEWIMSQIPVTLGGCWGDVGRISFGCHGWGSQRSARSACQVCSAGVQTWKFSPGK